MQDRTVMERKTFEDLQNLMGKLMLVAGKANREHEKEGTSPDEIKNINSFVEVTFISKIETDR